MSWSRERTRPRVPFAAPPPRTFQPATGTRRMRIGAIGEGANRSTLEARAPKKSCFPRSEPMLNSSVFPMSGKPKPREAEPNFEGAMDRLEKIVEQMESGKLPLEDLIVRYEEGMKLVKTCQERLANAEQKIEIITRNSAGKAVVQDFDPAQETTPPEKAAVESESTDDEIKLF